MDDLEEQLSRPRVEDEDSPIDGLRRQVALERLITSRAVTFVCIHTRRNQKNNGQISKANGHMFWSTKKKMSHLCLPHLGTDVLSISTDEI